MLVKTQISPQLRFTKSKLPLKSLVIDELGSQVNLVIIGKTCRWIRIYYRSWDEVSSLSHTGGGQYLNRLEFC